MTMRSSRGRCDSWRISSSCGRQSAASSTCRHSYPSINPSTGAPSPPFCRQEARQMAFYVLETLKASSSQRRLGPSPIQAFDKIGGLDSSPAQPLWLFAGMTNLGRFKTFPFGKCINLRAVAPDLVRGQSGEFAEHALRPLSANPMQWIGLIFVVTHRLQNLGATTSAPKPPT